MTNIQVVSVVNNDNNTINLEITSYKNSAEVSFINSVEAVMGTHNTSSYAHQSQMVLKADAADMETALNTKVDVVSGKGLSTNDFTDDLKSNYDAAVDNIHIHSNQASLDLVSGTNTGDQDLSGLADTDLSNLTSNALANLNTAGVKTVIQTYLNGESWYRVWSDGWIEQGGLISSHPVGNVRLTLTFIRTFTSSPLFGIIIAKNSGLGTAQQNLSVYNMTTTTMTYYVNDGQTGPIYWEAKGY